MKEQEKSVLEKQVHVVVHLQDQRERHVSMH